MLLTVNFKQMRKQLALFLKTQGWQARKAPLFVDKFLFFKNFWLPPYFSEEWIYITPKGKHLTFECTMRKLQKKLKKKLNKAQPEQTLTFQLINTINYAPELHQAG
jgi:hypothetical protein